MSNQRGPANYLRTSSLVKTLHFNEEPDQQTGKPRKERQEFQFDVTEEVSFTLTFEKTQDLMNRLVAAQNDPQGTGGVRISMYCRRNNNQNSGEEFDGAGILVYAQKPPRNNYGRQPGFQGGGGGRRSYPPRQQNQGAQGGTQQRGGYSQQQRPHGGQNGAGQNAQRTASPSRPPQQQAPQGNQYTQQQYPQQPPQQAPQQQQQGPPMPGPEDDAPI